MGEKRPAIWMKCYLHDFISAELQRTMWPRLHQKTLHLYNNRPAVSSCRHLQMWAAGVVLKDTLGKQTAADTSISSGRLLFSASNQQLRFIPGFLHGSLFRHVFYHSSSFKSPTEVLFPFFKSWEHKRQRFKIRKLFKKHNLKPNYKEIVSLS